MFTRMAVTLAALSLTMAAAHQFTGTWKMNTAKSKYTGVPMPKDLTVTYTPDASGWRYQAKGTSATGEPISTSFVYVKDGEEIKATGFPYGDTIVIRKGNTDSSSATFKREGKPSGSAKRVVSPDGKTMTITGTTVLPDGKKGSFTTVYDKQ